MPEPAASTQSVYHSLDAAVEAVLTNQNANIQQLLDDARAGRIVHDEHVTAEAVDAFLDERGVRRVVYAGWLAIDTLERARGEPLGRPRVKVVTWDELREAAQAVAAET